MAQPHPTFLTPPATVHSLPFARANDTSATFASNVSIYLDGKMTKRNGVNSCATSSRSAPTTVISNQRLCKCHTKVLHVFEGWRLCVACVKNVGICDSSVKEKVKNVLIEFAAFRTTTVVSPQLIATIHTPHVSIIAHDGHWAWKVDASTVSLTSLNTPVFIGPAAG